MEFEDFGNIFLWLYEATAPIIEKSLPQVHVHLFITIFLVLFE
jgi:hypothetical protein